MLTLEHLRPFRPENLHKEEHNVCDVALYKLINKLRLLILIENGIDLVCLRPDVLKYIIYFT